MRRRQEPKLTADVAPALPREIINLLKRVGDKLGRRPAKDVALSLACVPLVLPAPIIAGMIALSERVKGNRDPQWRLVLAISISNFVISVIALAGIAMLLGGWMAEQLNDFLGPLFLWPSSPDPESIAV
jgi:hypothetical protein